MKHPGIFVSIVVLFLSACSLQPCPTPDVGALEATVVAGVRLTLTADAPSSTPIPTSTVTITAASGDRAFPATPRPRLTPTEVRAAGPVHPRTPGEGIVSLGGPTPVPQVLVNGAMNVRAGPGTLYAILGQANAGERYPVTGRNSDGSWWQITYGGVTGWVAASLVTAEGAEAVGLAMEIPTPYPTMASAQVAMEAPTTAADLPPGDCPYVGNRNSMKLHVATCQWAAAMHPDNRVCFSSREEALAQGYVPCKVCNP